MLPDRSILTGQKLVENVNIEMRHFGWFSNNVDNSNLIFSSILPCLIYYYVFVYYCIILVFYHHFQGKAALTSFALNRWMVALHDKGHFTFIIVAEAVEVCISPGFPRYIHIKHCERSEQCLNFAPFLICQKLGNQQLTYTKIRPVLWTKQKSSYFWRQNSNIDNVQL